MSVMTGVGRRSSTVAAAGQGGPGARRSLDVEHRAGTPVGFDAEHFARFIELIPAPVTVLDADGMSFFVNRNYCDALGLTPEVVFSRTLDEALHAADVPTAQRVLLEAVTEGVGTADLRMAHADGRFMTFQWTLMYDANIEHIIAIAIDRTAERERLAEAHTRARTDEVTGVQNRAGFMEEFEDLHRRHPHGGLVVAVLDVDGFKEINDTNGHQVGDAVLHTTAQRLDRALAGRGCVGRFGGDEFVVVFPMDDDPVQSIARIEGAFTPLYELGDRHLAVGVSIGWCTSSGTETLEGVLRRADIAVYDAKRHGGGRVSVATDALVAAWERDRSIERGLERAVERDLVVPYFQPLIEPSTGRVAAYEVLTRWITDDGVVHPADEFADVAQRSGLLEQISARVRRAAFRVAAERPSIRLGFNVSSGELLAPGFVAEVIDSMLEHGVEPGRVVIEITEQTALRDVDRAAAVLGELREHGLRIALDDFGAGYSSLTYLTRLPIDTVKLDGRFVSMAAGDQRALRVLQAAVGFLRAIDLRVVVEGVETLADHRLVERLGVDRAQGWFYGRPVPACELPD